MDGGEWGCCKFTEVGIVVDGSTGNEQSVGVLTVQSLALIERGLPSIADIWLITISNASSTDGNC